jgi:hypothetical protein
VISTVAAPRGWARCPFTAAYVIRYEIMNRKLVNEVVVGVGLKTDERYGKSFRILTSGPLVKPGNSLLQSRVLFTEAV